MVDTNDPLVLSMVGAILAMVKCSLAAELVDECREREGREPRDDLDELLRISSISSSESLWGCGKSWSETAIHCSTNVLNEMCFFCPGSLSVGEEMGTVALGETLPEMGIRGGLLYLTADVRLLAMLVSDFVWIKGGRRGPESSSEDTLSSSLLEASRMGEDGLGMVSISDSVRCLRIGLEGLRAGPPGSLARLGLSMPSRSSVEAILRGLTGSTLAVWSGPYSHVTSESFSLCG